MRPTTTLIQLYLLAPVVFASPIPLVLVGDLEAVSGAAHPPAPVAAHRPKHALPEVIVFNSEEDDATPMDNSPIRPSVTAQPSVILSTHRPLTTEYLLSLTHHPWMRRKGGGPTKLVKLPADAVDAVGSSLLTQMGMGMGAEEAQLPVTVARIGMPCHYARMGSGRNDVLAVSLVFIFVAVVVAAEAFSRLVLLTARPCRYCY